MNRKNNMDAVRYYLAVSVLVAHFNELGGHNIYFPTSSFTAVGGFFALSGFLIYKSYINSLSFGHYIKKRAKRILPPYIFIVLLCAFGFSSISTLSITDYFTSTNWIKYVVSNLSFLNFIQPNLPGVFDTNEYVTSAVNGSLWTIKIEWLLYLSLPVFIWLHTKINKKKIYVFIGILVISIIYRIAFSWLYNHTGNDIYTILSRQIFGQLSYFYVGTIIYLLYDKFIAYKYIIIIPLAILIILSQYIPYYDLWLNPIVSGGSVIWFSMVGKWGQWLSNKNNVSYDMYLFHAPVIQLSIYLGINNLPTWQSFTIVILTTIALASFSWYFIGKRFYNKN